MVRISLTPSYDQRRIEGIPDYSAVQSARLTADLCYVQLFHNNVTISSQHCEHSVQTVI